MSVLRSSLPLLTWFLRCGKRDLLHFMAGMTGILNCIVSYSGTPVFASLPQPLVDLGNNLKTRPLVVLLLSSLAKD